MDKRLADLLKLLDLERIEINLFRGESRDIGTPQVFGGQVLSQALMAASATVDGRGVHSLHAYFLQRGDFNAPIVYEVDRARDGRSFSNRRVVAIQHGEQILNMTASFQVIQPGLEHQISMPHVPPPEDLKDFEVSRETLPLLPEKLQRLLQHERPFQFRPVRVRDFTKPEKLEPVKLVWLRAVDGVPPDQGLHRCLLTYVSDYHMLDTATLPHAISLIPRKLRIASIDHAMWFHRDVQVDDWLLYAIDSPTASGSRGFVRGSFFTRAGSLVASISQEGLIRAVPTTGGEPS